MYSCPQSLSDSHLHFSDEVGKRFNFEVYALVLDVQSSHRNATRLYLGVDMMASIKSQ